MPPTLTLTNARTMALHAQGLTTMVPFGEGRAGALRAIEHLGYVQIDTIAVVERAQHHVFWSRVPDYTPDLLHTLMAEERQVFEGWSHAASFLPMRDYRYYLPFMRAIATGEVEWWYEHTTEVEEAQRLVLARISAEGPLMSRDFEAPPGHKSGPWFAHKPTKRALSRLLMMGKLMVRERVGFQRVYDLTERVLPAWVDATLPSAAEWARFFIMSHLQAHGLATAQDMCHLKGKASAHIKEGLKTLTKSGDIMPVCVDGREKLTFYALSQTLAQPLPALDDATPAVRLLSPFDNLVIRRKRLLQLFDFDYLLECYVPEPKRRHGYFCLPILWGDRMIGRLDAKAERLERRLIVRKLMFDEGFRDIKRVRPALDAALSAFAAFNGCDDWMIESVTPSARSARR